MNVTAGPAAGGDSPIPPPDGAFPDDPAVVELAGQILANQRRQIGRAITLVESTRAEDRAKARSLLAHLRADPVASQRNAAAVRVGITGVPGAGKSTFINALGSKLIEQGHRVAVLAVDPSSSRTGGSILGDRTRMSDLSACDQAFIRPSPSGNHLGGVARATRESMLIVESAGYDVVLVETVGVGQSETAVAGMVDTFLLVTLARSGDQLQGIKRGIIEMADVITVNKADGDHEPEARVAARELRTALRLITSDPKARRAPVLTSSSLTGVGLMEVWEAVLEHREWLEESGGLERRRAIQQRDWMWALVDDDLLETVRQIPAVKARREELEDAVMRGDLNAVEASQEILELFAGNLPERWK
ncbi:MAG: methylmalonyl Co-A mutase-associated GTPase MeaB [Propionibacteriaceae bacterium]|jgi:LAO/AO transport system kinase|nr:methylmalonyl Co-A mutase-associated GTPase MeaB [Propionibacteriaceae bacterium]